MIFWGTRGSRLLRRGTLLSFLLVVGLLLEACASAGGAPGSPPGNPRAGTGST